MIPSEVPHTMLSGKHCCGSAVAMVLPISRYRPWGAKGNRVVRKIPWKGRFIFIFFYHNPIFIIYIIIYISWNRPCPLPNLEPKPGNPQHTQRWGYISFSGTPTDDIVSTSGISPFKIWLNPIKLMLKAPWSGQSVVSPLKFHCQPMIFPIRPPDILVNHPFFKVSLSWKQHPRPP